MSAELASLLVVTALAGVHVYAGTVSALHRTWHSRTLSAAAGVSVAYVFLELLPALAEDQNVIEESRGLLPLVDRDVYILALVGLTVSLWVEPLRAALVAAQRLLKNLRSSLVWGYTSISGWAPFGRRHCTPCPAPP